MSPDQEKKGHGKNSAGKRGIGKRGSAMDSKKGYIENKKEGISPIN